MLGPAGICHTIHMYRRIQSYLNTNTPLACFVVPHKTIMAIAGSWHNDAGMQLDTKSNQWFGATVASAGIDGPIVVSKLYDLPYYIHLLYHHFIFYYIIIKQVHFVNTT